MSTQVLAVQATDYFLIVGRCSRFVFGFAKHCIPKLVDHGIEDDTAVSAVRSYTCHVLHLAYCIGIEEREDTVTFVVQDSMVIPAKSISDSMQAELDQPGCNLTTCSKAAAPRYQLTALLGAKLVLYCSNALHVVT